MSAVWCRMAAQPVDQPVQDNFDRDGRHPSNVTCHCGAVVTPMLLQGRTGWYFPAHHEVNP